MEEYLDEHRDNYAVDTVIHDLDYWRQVLDPAIERCRIEKLIRGYSPSRVYRIHLEYARNGKGPASVVCKESRDPWPDTDPDGLNREWLVYRECLHHLPVIGPGLLHSERSATGNRLVLVDLELEHYFLPAQHVWSAAQFRPVLETLALLHVAAEDLPLQNHSLLMPEPDRRWDSHVVQTAIRTLVTDKTYGERARRLCPVVDELLEHLAAQFGHWQQQPRTLLHCDFNPSNVAFQQGSGAARLIDWHIAGTGMAAFEVASLFYPHFSTSPITTTKSWIGLRL